MAPRPPRGSAPAHGAVVFEVNRCLVSLYAQYIEDLVYKMFLLQKLAMLVVFVITVVVLSRGGTQQHIYVRGGKSDISWSDYFQK